MNDNPAMPPTGGPSAPQGASGPPRRLPMPQWPLTVIETQQITPKMRRAVFGGATLDAFAWKPGQDVVLMIPHAGGEPDRRHYTIRWFDQARRRLAIDFVLHGHDSPAVKWIKSAKPGDTLLAAGPRGRTVVNPDADWHLFTGDETCLPGIFAMLESLPAQAKAFAFIEIADRSEAQPLSAKADVAIEWIYRDGPASPSSQALIERFGAFKLPPGKGQAYVIGETSTVRAQRQGLVARGFDKGRIAAEGYWRPGRIGHHDHIWDDGEGPMRAAAPRPA